LIFIDKLSPNLKKLGENVMKHRRKRKSNRLIPIMLVFAIFAVGFYVFAIAGNGDGTDTPTDTPAIREASDTATAPHLSDFPAFTTPVSIDQLTDTQYLKLVNRARAIASPVNYAQLVTAWPDMPARTTYVALHETAFHAIQSLFTAANNANIGSLFIASGHRSHTEQSELYANAYDPAYVMPPGHSEHQLGLAADILLGDDTTSMRGSPAAQWLAENAPQFGLILRYPEDKQDITGVPYEPWHFRYVGRIHAWYMAQRGFVLEEYIAYLREQGGFQANFDGKTYYVLYQRPENGMIFIPENLNFWVSSANTGGYIVTAWR